VRVLAFETGDGRVVTELARQRLGFDFSSRWMTSLDSVFPPMVDSHQHP